MSTQRKPRQKTAHYWSYVTEKDGFYHCNAKGCIAKWSVNSNAGTNIDNHVLNKHSSMHKKFKTDTDIVQKLEGCKVVSKPLKFVASRSFCHVVTQLLINIATEATTINSPGNYKLVNDLVAASPIGLFGKKSGSQQIPIITAKWVKRLLMKIRIKFKASMAETLKNTKYSLVLDIWTAQNHEDYVGVKAFYKNKTGKICSSFMGLLKIENHNAVTILEALRESPYGYINNNCECLHGDNASNIKKLSKLFEQAAKNDENEDEDDDEHDNTPENNDEVLSSDEEPDDDNDNDQEEAGDEEYDSQALDNAYETCNVTISTKALGCIAHLINLIMKDYMKEKYSKKIIKVGGKVRRNGSYRKNLRKCIKIDAEWFRNGKIFPGLCDTRWANYEQTC